MNDLELGWAVGFFEGEGCFFIAAFNNRTRRYPMAVIENADEDVMKKFAAIVGVGTLRQRKTTKGNKLLWRWCAGNREDFKSFADLVRPYLGERRLARLIEVEQEATPIVKQQPKYNRPVSVI